MAFDPAAMLQVLGRGAIELPPQIASQRRQSRLDARQQEQDALREEMIRLQMEGQRNQNQWNDPDARRQRTEAERARALEDEQRAHERALEVARERARITAANRQPRDPNIEAQREQNLLRRKAQTAANSVLRPGQAAYIANQSQTPKAAAEAMVANARARAPDVPEHIIRAEVYRLIEQARDTSRGSLGSITPEMMQEYLRDSGSGQ